MMFLRRCLSLFLLPTMLVAQATPAGQAANVPATPEKVETSQAGEGAPAHAAAPVLTLQQQIAKLPPLVDTGVDVQGQSEKILAHLNNVLRFYRTGMARVQKVGEPSDILYVQQENAEVTQAAQFAFQSARNEAALLTRVQTAANTPAPVDDGSTPEEAQTEAQRMLAARTKVQAQIVALQAQNAALTAQIAKAPEKARGDLLQQQSQVQGGLELQQATAEALNRINSFSGAQASHAGLTGDIDRLESAAPELAATAKPVPPPALESFSDAEHSGLVSQASVLFQLLSARHEIDTQIAATDRLTQEAQALRTPFLKILRSTVAQGQALTAQTVNTAATPTTDAQDIAATRKEFDRLTDTFRVLANAMMPLSQEVVVLQAQRGTLSTWRVAVDSEYRTLLRSLLMRVGEIALGLLVLWGMSEIWNRATMRYVQDVRRRRQLLVVRRVIVGFVGGLIVMFGFITQFSSLATFAGFISAGIAVGLQTILLSVAAYFFIIGRYGVRVGDRITVVGVTGTVIEVGLARFYMMELVGTGTELHPTGRVAVFANSVLFQTGTPLYKQLPGTEYAWHELAVKLNAGAEVAVVTKALVDTVEAVYAGYRDKIDTQHRSIETWIGNAIEAPKIDSRLQMVDGGMQVVIHFPVQISGASQTDEAIATELMRLLRVEGPVKAGVASTPVINVSIKN